MKKNITQFLLSIAMLLLMYNTSYASRDENHTFTLKLLNSTNETFIIQSIASRTGVLIESNNERWMPNTTIDIHCENISSNSVFGEIRFLDSQNYISLLLIDVREQRHIGQPVFGIHNQYYKSKPLSKTRNTNIGGRFLTHTAATVELELNN